MNWTFVPDVAAWQFRYTFHWSWSANSGRTVMVSLGTHYFYIIWLPLRERQYAVVLQWLWSRPRPQGHQSHNPKTKGHNPQGQDQGRHFVASGQGLTSLRESRMSLNIKLITVHKHHPALLWYNTPLLPLSLNWS